jgi:hypothetical protein
LTAPLLPFSMLAITLSVKAFINIPGRDPVISTSILRLSIFT